MYRASGYLASQLFGSGKQVQRRDEEDKDMGEGGRRIGRRGEGEGENEVR